jgi:hypothetical protein
MQKANFKMPSSIQGDEQVELSKKKGKVFREVT